MDLVSDRGRRISVEELNTSRLLANARKQAHRRNLDETLLTTTTVNVSQFGKLFERTVDDVPDGLLLVQARDEDADLRLGRHRAGAADRSTAAAEVWGQASD